MSDTDLLRASRDGDQFHYYWAARQCLALLAPGGSLVAVSVEGVSDLEFPAGEEVGAGDQVIDIAEYYGSEHVAEAEAVIYRQLKHSTVRTTQALTMSELEKTLRGFSRRYVRFQALGADLPSKIKFELVSNRRVGKKVRETVEDLAEGRVHRHKTEMDYLRRYLSIEDDVIAASFARTLVLHGPEPGLRALRLDYGRGVSDFLAGMLGDAPLRLKEAVTERATSLQQDNVIRRADVLVALGATEEQLLPAPSRLAPTSSFIDRSQFSAAAEQILAAGRPVIVHAAGGVGKSVLAGALDRYLPPGSACVTYDCFGAGEYRRASEPRHEHRQALLQISNELAARRLCQPLVPAPTATARDYAGAFRGRVAQSAAALTSATPGALLVIVVDAADNAVMAADELDVGSFVPDLLAERDLPPSVRLVMFSRTERIAMLEPPPGVVKVELTGFTVDESRALLRTRFASASDADGGEFHRRTFGNPRVQAFALDESDSLEGCLRLLAGSTAADAASALDSAIAQVVENARFQRTLGPVEFDAICEALAALRPRVPVKVVAELCGVSPDVIGSFVTDLRRPLLLDGDCVQFRDEPTETWFRTNFRPTGQSLMSFVSRLRPLAEVHGYAAASLPQLMWEAKQFAELVELAVDGTGLPAGNDIERAEIEQQRIQFALKSAMRRDMKPEVGRLALKAASLALGHSRRLKLIKENTHLAGELLDGQVLDELVARRALSGNWPGSGLGYEGCMLSFAPGQRDFARSRLRSAMEWVRGWSRLPDETKEGQRLTPDDVAQIALGLVITDGPQTAVAYLGRWKPPETAFKAGGIVAARLIETGRLNEFEGLIVAASGNAFIQMAGLYQADRFDITLGREAAATVLATLRRRRTPIKIGNDYPRHDEYAPLAAAIAAVAAASHHGLAPTKVLMRILGMYMPASPPRGLGEAYTSRPDVVLKAFALAAHFGQRELTERDLAHLELLEEIDGSGHTRSRELDEFQRNITPLVPWVRLWARAASSATDDVLAELDQLTQQSYTRGVSEYQTPRVMLAVVARLSAQILSRQPSASLTTSFREWLQRVEPFLPWQVLIDIVRRTALTDHMDEVMYEVAAQLDQSLTRERTDASDKIDYFAELARAIRPACVGDAEAFFGRATATADKVGDDIAYRWQAITAVARRAAQAGEDGQRAYLVARTFEALSDYMGDGADHEQCIQTIAMFSRPTAVALASRWRSRRMGHPGNTLGSLLKTESLLAPAVPFGAVALTPLADRVDLVDLLEQVLSPGTVDPARLMGVISYYDRIQQHKIDYFERVSDLAERHSVDLKGTSYAPDSYQHRVYDSVNATGHLPHRWTDSYWDPDNRRPASLATLQALDLTKAEDLETARRMCSDRERRLTRDDLVDKIMATSARHLRRVINNLRANTHFDAFTYQQVLGRLVNAPSQPPAAADATRELALDVATRFCSLVVARAGVTLPLNLLSRATGQTEDALFERALAAMGARSDFIDARDCLSLVGTLTARLSPSDAREILDQAVAELSYLNEDETADGPWNSSLMPPSDLHQCTAGYIWSALADADASVRWRAAHAVNMLCQLGATLELQALVELAASSSPGPFCDARLPFYDKHARVWLFMALERASTDATPAVVPFEALLRSAVFGEDTHVLLRESARRVLMALDHDGLINLCQDEREHLERVNRPIELVSTDTLQRSPKAITRASDEDGYHFRFDFADYWIEPLARCFDLPERDVARMISYAITSSQVLDPTTRRVEDPRRTRRIIDDERTFFYKSEMPAVHDLDFYLSFHALMAVAGQLIDTRPVCQEPYDADDPFERWLQEYRPSRPDGRWLADRRDAVPMDQRTLQDPAFRDGPWTSPVQRDDLLAKIFDARSGEFTVWEWSQQDYGKTTETGTVETALVEPTRAMHLLAAWQTSDSCYHFSTPAAGGDGEFDADGYRLVGWIEDITRSSDLDEHDPFAGGVNFPAPRPSAQACHWMDVTSDADQRFWTHQGTRVMTSTVWADTSSDGTGRSVGSQGHRLTVTPDVLGRLATESAMSVIFKVTIARRIRDAKKDGIEPDEPGTPNPGPPFTVVVFDGQRGFIEL
ncbi:hypothetical protein R8Z50_21930 [Longispora sp. K20-0274]|uniref:hypothetical protein n=1 Tax=Longispora sp. K20-0274 TaxID=3088255 RepID=UPI00399AAD8F